jgi:hypothetical protein
VSVIATKAEFYKRFNAGEFGNRLRTWPSLEAFWADKSFAGTVSMRYAGTAGGAWCRYDVPISEIGAEAARWVAQGAKRELIQMNESAPDERIVVQGEAVRRPEGLAVFCSRDKTKMRTALRTSGKQYYGLVADMIMRQSMTPSSYDDIQDIFERYPDSVIEFSVYSICLGDRRGRNTIVWEVRNY